MEDSHAENVGRRSCVLEGCSRLFASCQRLTGQIMSRLLLTRLWKRKILESVLKKRQD